MAGMDELITTEIESETESIANQEKSGEDQSMAEIISHAFFASEEDSNGNQSVSNIASTNESISNQEESSEDQSMGQITSDAYFTIEEDSNDNQSVSNIASTNESIADGAMFYDSDSTSDTSEAELANEVPSEYSSTNLASANSRLGLLDLPPELRVGVYRHLLVRDHPLRLFPFRPSWYSRPAIWDPFPPILQTCRLIRREAFQVLFGENSFSLGNIHPLRSNRQVHDTIQNVYFTAHLGDSLPFRKDRELNDLYLEFVSPIFVRNTLTVVFKVDSSDTSWYPWYSILLRRFTNFRTVRIEFVDTPPQHATDTCIMLADLLRGILAPHYGPSELFADGRGLEFHPRNYLELPASSGRSRRGLDGLT